VRDKRRQSLCTNRKLKRKMLLIMLQHISSNCGTKADSCWTQQDADKKDLQEQLMKVHTEQESNRLRYAQEKAWQEEKYNTMQKQMTDLQELLKSCPDTILLPRSSETNVTGEPRGARPGGTDTHCKSLEEEAEDLMDEYGEEDSGPEFGSPPPTTTKQVVPIPSNITDSQKKVWTANSMVRISSVL
jgi:hypothetical protein